MTAEMVELQDKHRFHRFLAKRFTSESDLILKNKSVWLLPRRYLLV